MLASSRAAQLRVNERGMRVGFKWCKKGSQE
jgi:hypothetical protein